MPGTIAGMPGFDLLSFLVEFCSLPTAPFREQRVMAYVDRFARRFRSLKSSRDTHGNTLLVRPGTGRSKGPRLIFVAHLDHPGFVIRDAIDARTLRADFRGRVEASFVNGSRVSIYDADRVIRARVIEAIAGVDGRTDGATLRVAQPLIKPVTPGSIGMFDVGTARIVGKRLHSRACDDLAGAAAALTMLVDLAASPATSDIGVLLTRGEEAGFIGAIAAAQDRTLLRDDDRMISIETSAEQPVARQGDGVVLRIGDRMSVFHSAFSRFLFEQAGAIGKMDTGFKFQRALMPAGTCEATVFDAWGFVTAAVCIPLGNYHNQDRVRNRIAAEHVHVEDWLNMVTLFGGIARTIHTFDGSHAALREQLTARFEASRALLA